MIVRLSSEAKEAIIAKALSRGDTPLAKIAKESGVGYSTLYRWIYLKRHKSLSSSQQCSQSSKGQGQTPPLQHILATVGLDEEAVGAYCRVQGIHSFQLKQWQDELKRNDGNKTKSDSYRKELKELRNEIKNLKKDLHRKDKALAETSALLVLKKKADLIWGDIAEG